jgi:hypothetical protein
VAAEHRNHTRLQFQAEGEDDGALPQTFRLIAWDTPQRRNSRTKGKWISTAGTTHRTVAEGITRQELVTHIEDTADWLAWNGDDG